MNLPAIFNRIGGIVKNTAGTTGLLAKKHAPELMMASGFVGFIVTIIETVRATNETNEILEYKETKMALIERESAENPSYTNDIRVMDEKNVARNTRIALVKAWWKVGAGVIFTGVSFGGAYKIINGRYVAATLAYEGAEKFIARYRQNVVDEFGKEVDWRMAHSVKAEEFEAARKEREENRQLLDDGKKRTKKPRTAYQDINNQIFDARSSTRWKPYWLPQQMIDFIMMAESKLQDKVDSEGSAVLNDGFDILGMPRTSQGALIGWINRPGNNHNREGCKVSLGFANNETPIEEIRRILGTASNEELYCWITPNCDGVIYNLIDVPYDKR